MINIGSVASTNTPPMSVVYTASKGAVDAITRVLAKELGPRKIRVNSINPGGVETEGTHRIGIVGSEFQQRMVADTPLGRFGQPEDIAPIAVFLASGPNRAGYRRDRRGVGWHAIRRRKSYDLRRPHGPHDPGLMETERCSGG